jgi:uncharacterized membrane protein
MIAMDADPNSIVNSPGSADSQLSGLVSYTHWIYALHSLSVLSALLTARAVALHFVFGLPSIIAVIMNYARRSETRGTWLESHFRWQIRTFWFALLWIFLTSIIAMPLLLIGVGFILGLLGFGLVGLWVIYRIVRGWLSLRDGHSMPVLATLP